jgi:Flp pilus assembly protein TadD
MRFVKEWARRDPGAALVALALVFALALYSWTLGRGIVNYDDPSLYRDNWIVQDASWQSVRTIWFELEGPHRYTLSPEYLPIRDTSVMLDFAIWGNEWGGFHATNLILYLAAIVIWFFALVYFGIDRTIAGLAILLWAVHPSHAESVAWLSERKGLLGVMFAGLCTLGFARYRARRAWGWLILAIVAAVFAVWSKALAAFAVGAIAGFEIALPARRVSWRRSLVGLGAIAVCAGIAFVPVLYLAMHSDVVGTEVRAPGGRLEMVLGVLGFYVRMGAMTVRNAVAYPLSTHGPSFVDIVLGVIALSALVLLVVAPRKLWISSEARAGAWLWIFAWLPASHLVLPLQMIFVADRYMLVPSLGLALIVAAGIVHSKRVPTRAKKLLVAALVVAAAVRTLDAQANWRNDLALWQRAVASDPDNGDSWSFYVQALADDGADEVALAALEEGLARTRTPRLLMRLANVLIARGDRAGGIAIMREAALANESRAMANLALLLFEDKRTEEALEWARRAGGVPYAHNHRVHGKIALASGAPAEGLVAFEKAHALEPWNAQNQYNLALALIAVGRANDARQYLLRCVRSPPTMAACRAELAKYRRL